MSEYMTSAIAARYFDEHPDAMDGLKKAHYAWHATNYDAGAHSFYHQGRQCECAHCGRTREDVRYDELPAQCQKRPERLDIADTIRGEEEKYRALLRRGKDEIPRLIAKHGMSGATLALLQQTYGYDVDVVTTYVDVPKDLQDDFHDAMERHREESRSARRADPRFKSVEYGGAHA